MKDVVVIPIFNDEHKVVVTWGDEQRWRKLARSYGHYVGPEEDVLEGRLGVTLAMPGRYPLIVLPRFPITPAEYSTLAHEAVHAMDKIYEAIPLPSGGEIYANGVGAVVRIVLQAKPGKKRK